MQGGRLAVEDTGGLEKIDGRWLFGAGRPGLSGFFGWDVDGEEVNEDNEKHISHRVTISVMDCEKRI
jgi:hypothetical protein